MAARTRKGTKTVPMPDSWREKIRVTEIMTRVQRCALGKLDMNGEQLKAAGMVLAKVIPDLARQEHTGKDGEPLQVTILKLGDNPEMLEKLRLQMFPDSVKTIYHKRDDNGA